MHSALISFLKVFETSLIYGVISFAIAFREVFYARRDLRDI